MSAKLKGAQISAQKERLVADQVRGRHVDEALDLLEFSPKKASKLIKKLLDSAIANAENNEGADVDELVISSVFVDEREAAENEAGELIYADASDHWDFNLIVGDLSDLCLEKVGRTDNDEITLFKSVGLAVEDVVVAAAVWAAQSN